MAGDPLFDTLANSAQVSPFGGMQRRTTPSSYLDANGRVVSAPVAPDINTPVALPSSYNPANDPNNPDNPNNTNSQFHRGLVAGIKGIPTDLKALKGYAEAAVGDQADADKTYAEVAKENEHNAAIGPRVTSLHDVHSAGDFGDYAAGELGSLVPTIASIALTRGAGSIVGKAVTKGVEGAAVKGAENAAADAAKRAAAQKIGAHVGEAAGLLPTNAAGNIDTATDTQGGASGQARGIAALAGTAVESALQSYGVGKLLGDGTVSKAATDATEKYLPRVLKATARNAGAMGAANAASTAAALAAHKAVNSNVGLLTPQAFNQYLDSGLSGALLGGVAGGGKEALHGISFDAAHLAKLRELGAAAVAKFGKSGEPADESSSLHPRAVDLMQSVHSSLNNPEARQATTNAFATHYKDLRDDFGKDADAAATKFVSRSYTQALDDAKTPEAKADIMSAFGKAIDDTVPGVSHKDAASQFDEHLSNIEGNAQGDTDVAAPSGALDQRPQNNPVKMDSPLENLLAAYIPHDHPLWAFPDTVKGMAASVAKLFHGDELTSKDNANLDLWSRIVGPEQVKTWREAGPQYAALTRTTEHIDSQPEPATAMQAAMQKALADRAAASQPLAASEGSDAGEVQAAEDERAPEAASAGADVNVVDRPRGTTLSQQVDAEPPGPARDVLIAQLRDQVDRQGALVTENRSSPKAAALWASKDPSVHANTVEIEPKQVGTTRDGQPVMRRQALQLDNLVSAKLRDDPGIGAYAALLQVLGDIQSAGHVIDPKSITRGVFYTSKDGSKERLSARQAQDIRRSLGSGERPDLSRAGTPAKRTPTDQMAPTSAETPTVRENSLLRQARGRVDDHPNAPMETAQERVLPHASETMGSEVADSRQATSELGPRDVPPGSPREITSEGDVRGEAHGNARVTLRGSPYEELVNRTRRHVEVLKTPAQRGAAKHAAGVEIGTRELAKEHENGAISDKRFASEMERLHDYSSGLSRKYLYDAANGKYDSASYHETPADNPKIDRAALKQENSQFGAQDDRDDNDIAVGFKEASQPQGPHDHAKETRMLNAVAKRLGVPEISAVKPLSDGNMKKGGSYAPNSKVIYINPNLHGPERIEVLAHELGHHIINHEIAQALGIKAHEVPRLSEDVLFGERNADGERSGGLLAEHAPELHKALMGDYDKWLDEQSDARAKVSDVLASRKGMFRGEGIQSRSTGETVAQLIQRGGNVGYVYSAHEWLADHITRALTQGEEGSSIIGKFFKGIADKIKAAYTALFGTPDRAKYAPAPSVEAWVQHMFERTTSDVSAALERTVSQEEGIASIKAAMHAVLEGNTTQADSPAFHAFSDFLKYQLGPNDRRVWFKALNRPTVERQIVARYGHDEALMKQLDSSETREATQAHLAYKMWARGELKLGLQPTDVMYAIKHALLRVLGVATNNDMALKLFEDTKNGEIQRLNVPGKDLGYDLRAKMVDTARNPSIQKSFNVASALGRQYIYDPWRKYGFGTGQNAEQSMTPALAQGAALIKRHTGEAGEHGLIPTSIRRRQNFYRAAGEAVKGLTKAQITAVHEAMQRKAEPESIADPAVRRGVVAQRALFARIRDYAVKAGVPIGEIEKYYPVLMDRKAVQADPEGFKALLNQPHFERGIRSYFSDDKGTPSSKPLPELIDKLHRYATGGDFGERDRVPTESTLGGRTTAEKRRVLDFIYKDGTPADIEKFIGYQEKNPERVLRSHIDSMVRRAESVQRFGVRGEKLDEIVADAKKQHASAGDIQNFLDYVTAASGRYATDGSPAIRRLFDKLGKPEAGKKVNKVLFGPKGKAVQDMLLAYQNVRVLPLALLSSLVDPLGIGVRYGGWKSLGDVHTYFQALKDGMVAASGGESQAHLRALGDAVGMADDYLNTEILSNGYGGEGMSGFARKLSDAMFKYNGMNWLTKSTRYMALSMGQHFLLKHAAGAEPGANGSARYLRELGIQDGDVKPGEHGGVKLLNETELEHATPEARAADERVRAALNRFVDEAVLRTDASQHPIWMNDPAFRLVSQYKAFSFAFADQILGRIRHEMYYANYHVLGPALAYLPITMMAEMLRGFAQYGPGGNPNQQQWTPAEYAAFIGQRSGMVGPRMQQLVKGWDHESTGYSGLLQSPDVGPTAAQLEDFLHTAEGKRSVEKSAVESLPASTLYQHRVTN